MHHAFLYISLLSLHDYNMKMPNCKFYGGYKQAVANLSFSSKLEWGLQEFNSMEICLHLTFSANYKSLKKREFILKVTFLVPSASSMLKLPRLSVKWWWMKLKLSIVAETVYCIVLFRFLWCQRKFDGGGLKKNEGTCTYGVVSGRSCSGLYDIWWWNGWVTRRDPGNEWYGDLTWKW